MTAKASVLLQVPGGITLDGFDALVEKLRETAAPFPGSGNRSILIQWEDEDAWNLRGTVEETVADIESEYYGVGIEFPDRFCEKQGGDDTNLAVFQWWTEPSDSGDVS